MKKLFKKDHNSGENKKSHWKVPKQPSAKVLKIAVIHSVLNMNLMTKTSKTKRTPEDKY